MKKIASIFVRDEAANRRYVRDEVTAGCEWVLAGEGRATRKFDGSCCLLLDGVLYARRELKPGQDQPAGFEFCDFDPVTNKTVGWVKCEDTPEYARHKEAFIAAMADGMPADGTYELCGPKVNGNPEGYESHVLVAHSTAEEIGLANGEETFETLRAVLTDPLFTWEGIVWHHPDGRMAKLKKRDFPSVSRDKDESR